VPGQPSQKIHTTNDWAQWYTPVIPATKGSTDRRIMVQDRYGHEARPFLKCNHHKKAWWSDSSGTAPASHQALSSNPSTATKKKKEEKKPCWLLFFIKFFNNVNYLQWQITHQCLPGKLKRKWGGEPQEDKETFEGDGYILSIEWGDGFTSVHYAKLIKCVLYLCSIYFNTSMLKM
jgi:hypothetical protein